jgi:hypothetical protein
MHMRDTSTHSLYVPRAESAVAPKTDIIVACTHAYTVWCIDPLLNEVTVDVPKSFISARLIRVFDRSKPFFSFYHTKDEC